MSNTVLEMAQEERDAINSDRIRLMERVAELEKENKALLHDLRLADRIDCDFCKHQNGPCTHEDCHKCSAPCPCGSCRKNSNYVWRGVCEANSK